MRDWKKCMQTVKELDFWKKKKRLAKLWLKQLEKKWEKPQIYKITNERGIVMMDPSKH